MSFYQPQLSDIAAGMTLHIFSLTKKLQNAMRAPPFFIEDVELKKNQTCISVTILFVFFRHYNLSKNILNILYAISSVGILHISLYDL